MKDSTKRMFSILLAIFFLLSSVFIYSVFIKSAYDDIYNLRNKTLTLEQSFNNYTSLNENFQNILAQYRNLGDLENQLSLILPSAVDIPYAVNQIMGIAKINKLEVLSLSAKQLAIKPSSNNLAKGLGILRIDGKLTGNYNDFKSFLSGLETNMMISDIVNFRIEKESGSNLLYNITIDTYYQAE